jgi:hypothetical protein
VEDEWPRSTVSDERPLWAIQLDPSLDEQYINAEGNLVVWTFERVLEVQAILEEQLGDGVEVKSLAKLLRAP